MTYINEGVCAKEINFEIVDNKVQNVRFIGGFPGNLNAVASLVEGMRVEDVIKKFKGNLCRNGTSCADQFAKALKSHLSKA